MRFPPAPGANKTLRFRQRRPIRAVEAPTALPNRRLNLATAKGERPRSARSGLTLSGGVERVQLPWRYHIDEQAAALRVINCILPATTRSHYDSDIGGLSTNVTSRPRWNGTTSII